MINHNNEQRVGTGKLPESTNAQNTSIKSALLNLTNIVTKNQNKLFKDSTRNIGLNTDLNRNNSQNSTEQTSWFKQLGSKLDNLFTYLKKNTDSHNKITENILKEISTKLKSIDNQLIESNKKNAQTERFDLSNIDKFVKQFDPNVLNALNENMRLINTKLQLLQDKLLNNSTESNVSSLTPELQNFFNNYLTSISDNQSKILESVNQSIEAITNQSNVLKEYIDRGWQSLDFSNLENTFTPQLEVLNKIDDKFENFIKSFNEQNQVTSEKLASINAATELMTTDKNAKTDELLTSINNYIQNNIKPENISNNINTNIQNSLNDYSEKIKSYYESNSNAFQQELRNKLDLINSNINTNVGNIINSINALNNKIFEASPNVSTSSIQPQTVNTNSTYTTVPPVAVQQQAQPVIINKTQLAPRSLTTQPITINKIQSIIAPSPVTAIQQKVNSDSENRSNYFSVPSLSALNNEESKNNLEIVRGLAIPKTISTINPEAGALKNMSQFQLETIRNLQEVNANIKAIKNSIINHFTAITKDNYRKVLTERFRIRF